MSKFTIAIEFWFLIWCIASIGIPVFWYTSNKENVNLIKLFVYAGLTATISTITMSSIVVLFN